MVAVGRGLNSTVQCCMKLLAALQKSEQGNLVCAGEVDELEGLVTSLRAQCPIKDEPGHSNDIPHAASRSGDQQRPEKPPAESFTQVALTVQALPHFVPHHGFCSSLVEAQLQRSVLEKALQSPFLMRAAPQTSHSDMSVPADQGA